MEPLIRDIAAAVAARGGRALVVGGYVRDLLRGEQCKDIDVEVYGLEMDALEAVLSRFGAVELVGRVFGVLKLSGLNADFALPRREMKVAAGHRGFEVVFDPHLSFTEASRRRDLTMNSIGLDPLTGELVDPHGGQQDLAARRLRATDARFFSEDPLRGLRVAQFAARFDMQPDPELVELCRRLDLSELSVERIFEELVKLLGKGRRPSVGLAVLKETELVRFFPELATLIGVAQDREWHPEGDVWTHTAMALDAAARLRDGGPDDTALMFAVLCHDLGKPSTTVTDADGRIRSPGHEGAGVAPTTSLLTRLRAPNELVACVAALVSNHLAPASFLANAATARGYRRLARKLAAAHATIELLARVARADYLGRTTADARAGCAPTIDAFMEQARKLLVASEPPRDIVMGRHLIARGLPPGKDFSDILARCRELQDETGLTDPERILDVVLEQTTRKPPAPDAAAVEDLASVKRSDVEGPEGPRS